MHSILTQLKARHRQGQAGGMFAVCTSHPMVLRAAMATALESDQPLLIEATANQINQFGGYTGMTPAAFSFFVRQSAREVGLPADRVLIGADHLGPYVWKHESAATAMQKAEELVRQCVGAGFQKIHLDTGTGCADDPGPQLPVEVTAQRAARLCHAAEAAAGVSRRPERPLYVIGNEVPTPGGGLEEGREVAVTDPDQLIASLEIYKRAFGRLKLTSAWGRIVAAVVQPGVDFGDRQVAAYRPERAARLSAAHERLPGIMTYEIHATDYQSPNALEQMAQAHFILLKVGPCLTFALCRALYALADIEADLPGIASPSNLPRTMERLMIERPGHWQSHYHGTPESVRQLRHHSLRDRIRYYWFYPEARDAANRLIQNLGRPIPAALLKQHLPDLSPQIERLGQQSNPAGIIQLAIRSVLMPYAEACRWQPVN